MALTKVTFSMIDGVPVNVNDYGAVGDGVTDDSAAIQAAINACPAGGTVVGGPNQIYAMASRVNISNKELRNIRFVFTANTTYSLPIGTPGGTVNGPYFVVGGAARITNVTVSIGTTNRGIGIPLRGVLNLHLADGVVIDGFEITDAGDPGDSCVGISCTTLASNVVIRNCRLNYIGWPIFYADDMPPFTEAYARTVDGTNYSGQTIGTGLFISQCELGAADKAAWGDGIEINTPLNRFSNVRVNNCTILKTVSISPASGLGMGFADIDRLQILNNYIAETTPNAGAIHTETCTATTISNNTIYNCITGIGLGEKADDHVIIGNAFQSCREAIFLAGTLAGKQCRNIIISNNGFYDTGRFCIQMVNIIGAIISNNTFKDITETIPNLCFIVIIQSAPLSTSNINIQGNNFIRTNANVVPLLGGSGTTTEFFSSQNQFIGIGGSEIASYIVQVKSRGLTTDHYKNSGATSGMQITINTDPTGWVTGTLGDMATDIVAGNIYRNNGTNWILELP
jgi:hypothetical protein